MDFAEGPGRSESPGRGRSREIFSWLKEDLKNVDLDR